MSKHLGFHPRCDCTPLDYLMDYREGSTLVVNRQFLELLYKEVTFGETLGDTVIKINKLHKEMGLKYKLVTKVSVKLDNMEGVSFDSDW